VRQDYRNPVRFWTSHCKSEHPSAPRQKVLAQIP
jgi:hypothetical protein